MYVIQEKNGKTEYDFAQPESQVCVRSLFLISAIVHAGTSAGTPSRGSRYEGALPGRAVDRLKKREIAVLVKFRHTNQHERGN